jgi:hypothetical protein
MTMKNFVRLLVVSVVFVACGGGGAASPGTGQCSNQVNMSNAVVELRQARAALDSAEHNKGGWRVAAINATNEAIREAEQGCAVANGQ